MSCSFLELFELVLSLSVVSLEVCSMQLLRYRLHSKYIQILQKKPRHQDAYRTCRRVPREEQDVASTVVH